jgi:predicted nucleic-acid-binding protein
VISLDTNVLVLLFVDEPNNTEQSNKARQMVSRYKTVYISQILQIETVWVLSRAYDFFRVAITQVLESLLKNQACRLENQTIFAAALHLYQNSNIDFSDALILAYRKIYSY